MNWISLPVAINQPLIHYLLICRLKNAMGHDHSHHHHHHHSDGNLKVAFFLNLGFTIIEIIGGIYVNSLAILSDALHDAGDSLALGLAWYCERLSQKGQTRHFTYGYKRFSLLGAVINALILVVGSAVIMAHAIPALFSPGEPNAQGMVVLAILGVIVNGAAVFKLRKAGSLNERVVMLHLLEDVFGWLAVLIGSVVMIFWDAPFIDPLLSLMIALLILYNAAKNLYKGVRIIMQSIPEKVSLDRIKTRVTSIEAIAEIHDSHIWSMDGQYNVMTLHVKLNQNLRLTEQFDIKCEIRQILREESVQHATLELESLDEDCKFEDDH